MSEIINVLTSKLKANPDNPRFIRDEKFNKLVQSLKDFPEMLDKRPVIIDEAFVILGGNMRYRAAKVIGLKHVPCQQVTDWTEEQKREFIIKDNVGFGEWDWDILTGEWDAEQLGEWGLDLPDFNAEDDEPYELPSDTAEPLTETFLVPPFTVLDSRQGYWKERKKYWLDLIGDNGESREQTLSKGKNMLSDINNGVSILDPVLAEIIVRWFTPKRTKAFDCFAGDSVFGVVADALGCSFTGIELRQQQADLNNSRLAGSKSKYICDDGRNVLNHISENSQDLLFSCPPYYDLEVYSELENDASNQGTYEEFLELLTTAFHNSIKALKNNRFAVVVVGDIRDKQGFYRLFVDDVKAIFKSAGVQMYNEMILVEPLGTLPQRVRGWMRNRKVGKCHQNVLVFYKGNTNKIKATFPEVELNIEEEDESANV